MPKRAPRPCSRVGCSGKAQDGHSLCARHLSRQRAHSDTKRKATRTDYSARGHRSFRSAVLGEQPWCVRCGGEATVADHYPLRRRELIARGLDPDDPQYGRGLCAPCHNSHTARDEQEGRIAPPLRH